MENTLMNILKIGLLFALMFGVMAYDKPYETQRILDKLVEQNKALQKQMATITAGLTEMCRAVNIASCDCNNQSPAEESNDIRQDGTTNELKLLRLTSYGEVDDSVRLTLKFEAAKDYSLEWMQMFLNGNGMVRTSGNLQKTELISGRYLYTSNFHLQELRLTRTVLARIYSFGNIASLNINLTAISVKGEQLFKDIEYKVSRYPKQVVVPRDLETDYNVTMQIERKVLELEELRSPGTHYTPDIYFTFINKSDYPNTVAERYSHNGITISQTDNGIGDLTLVVTLLKEDIDSGGVFSFSIPQVVDQYLEALHYGIVIEVVREGYDSIVPQGTLALYTDIENIYVMSSVISVFCFAMGNPSPEVSIFRERKGQLKELKSEAVIQDKVTHHRAYTLHDTSKKGKALAGTFVCRASNNNNTIESRTVLKVFKPIEFDDRKTLVTLNTTEKITVSCKESGNPRPELEIRLGSNFGPDLLVAEGNFTHKTTSKRETTKVSISFSPPDSRFDVLYCFANQMDDNMYETNEKEIRLFPMNTDWNYDSWSFYESFRKSSYDL